MVLDAVVLVRVTDVIVLVPVVDVYVLESWHLSSRLLNEHHAVALHSLAFLMDWHPPSGAVLVVFVIVVDVDVRVSVVEVPVVLERVVDDTVVAVLVVAEVPVVVETVVDVSVRVVVDIVRVVDDNVVLVSVCVVVVAVVSVRVVDDTVVLVSVCVVAVSVVSVTVVVVDAVVVVLVVSVRVVDDSVVLVPVCVVVVAVTVEVEVVVEDDVDVDDVVSSTVTTLLPVLVERICPMPEGQVCALTANFWPGSTACSICTSISSSDTNTVFLLESSSVPFTVMPVPFGRSRNCAPSSASLPFRKSKSS